MDVSVYMIQWWLLVLAHPRNTYVLMYFLLYKYAAAVHMSRTPSFYRLLPPTGLQLGNRLLMSDDAGSQKSR
jgi:hypothetical protein